MRGSNFNYGDGLKMALDAGAMPWGHWGGCHATPIVAEAPDYGVRNLTDKTNQLSYPYGVMLNVEGKRWIDEGADFNAFTYAKYGGLILNHYNYALGTGLMSGSVFGRIAGRSAARS